MHPRSPLPNMVWSCLTTTDTQARRNLLMRPLSTFSGGQTVTAALTALLYSDPEFILLDEPTNNLDSAAKASSSRHWRRCPARRSLSATTATYLSA